MGAEMIWVSLGMDKMLDSAVPVPVNNLDQVSEISVGSGGAHSIVLKRDGTVAVWGFRTMTASPRNEEQPCLSTSGVDDAAFSE